jgi:hypothetical protein
LSSESSDPTASITSRIVAAVTAIATLLACSCGLSIWPSWRKIPFLTGEFARMLPVVYVGFVSAGVFFILTIFHPGMRLEALGSLVNSAIGLGSSVMMWLLFPFTFAETGWGMLVRILIALVRQSRDCV